MFAPFRHLQVTKNPADFVRGSRRAVSYTRDETPQEISIRNCHVADCPLSERSGKDRRLFDAQTVRPYFPYEQVQAGISRTAARLFRVEFEPVKNTMAWDRSADMLGVFDAASGRQVAGVGSGRRRLGKAWAGRSTIHC